MKTVLLPTAPQDHMTSVMQCAVMFAKRFDAYIEGFALRPPMAEIVSVDMVMGLTWAADERADAESETQARQLFEGYMSENGVPRDAGAMGSLCHRWAPDAPPGDDFIGSYSRVFDATVLGRPDQRAGGPRMTTLEAVLFEGGRPVLLAPPEPVKSIGETIVIAWNGSTETAHVVAMAMPLFPLAKRIVVLTVEGALAPGPSGEQLTRSLQRHGLNVETVAMTSGKRNPGQVILDYAGEVGCDLLVKGAYTQSRIRQMIFGGATSHILANATIPVFMAH